MCACARVPHWVRLLLTLLRMPKAEVLCILVLKHLLLKPNSGVYHYGPSLIEHCLLVAGLDPAMSLTCEGLEGALPPAAWDGLVAALREEGARVIGVLFTLAILAVNFSLGCGLPLKRVLNGGELGGGDALGLTIEAPMHAAPTLATTPPTPTLATTMEVERSNGSVAAASRSATTI